MSEAVCPICCDDGEDDALHTLECGHVFHTNCILQWFRQGAPTCPLCRATDDDTARLSPLDTMARCALLRQRARRKDAPGCLKRLVQRLRVAEEDLRNAGKDLRAFETEHRSVIRGRNKRLVGKWRKWRRVRQLKRQVGVYTHPDVALPLVTWRHRLSA